MGALSVKIMKITLSEQSRRTLRWSAWLATAIIALHAIPVTIVALIARGNAEDRATYKSIYLDQINDAALIVLVALIIAVLIIFALKKFLPVQSPKLGPDAKGLIRTIILAAVVGAIPAAAMICFANGTINRDGWGSISALFHVDIPFILLMTSFFSTIALCVMALRRDAVQKVTDCKQPALVPLAAAGMIILAFLVSKFATGMYMGACLELDGLSLHKDIFTDIGMVSKPDIICITTLIIYAIGRFIITRTAKFSRVFSTYRIVQAIYIVAAIASACWLPLGIVSIIAFAGASVVLSSRSAAFKAIKPCNTIYSRLAMALNFIAPIFLAIPIIMVNGAAVPITVARFCSRRALQQDSNDQFAKACLIINNCNIILCIVIFFVRLCVFASL